MATVDQRHASSRPNRGLRDDLDLLSLAVVFVAVVGVALALVGIAVRGTNPVVLIVPVLVGVLGILGLRK